MNEPAAVALTERITAAGFLCLGGFNAAAGDQLPVKGDGAPTRSLLLIGSTGPSIWGKLCDSPEWVDGDPDPLDRYTRRALTNIARMEDFGVVFPFEGPPYHPFQQWAKRCGGFSQSPMGVLAHQHFGPWTGFRAAFLSAEVLNSGEQPTLPGPCHNCVDKPCISACPATALSQEAGYDVPKCRDHLSTSRSLDCWSGCLARRACPFGANHRQTPDNARYHMERFAAL